TIEAAENLNAVVAPVASTGFLHFNFRDERLQDKRVRQALAKAVDMENFVEIVYSGMAEPTGAVIPRALWAHAAHLGPHAYNPEEAKKLLEEAGVKDLKLELWAVP